MRIVVDIGNYGDIEILTVADFLNRLERSE